MIWKAEFGEELDRILLLAGDRGVLVSAGRKVLFLDEAGLQRWTVTLKGKVVGFGFSSHEAIFFIAYENGIRLVNRIGVTMKELPLASSPVDFVVSEMAVILTQAEVLVFARDGRELWKSDSGGNNLATFHDRIFLGNGKKLIAFTKAGREIAEMDFTEDIVALSGGENSLFVALPQKILSVTEDCEISLEKSLDDTVLGLSADELVAVLHSSKVALYDQNGEERWLFPAEASAISTEGKAVAVAVEKELSYFEEVGESDVLYEIMCRGESRCGTFVSSSYLRQCPKCKSSRITMRIVKRDLD